MMSSEKVKCLRACAMIYANILLKGICQVDIAPLVMWTAYSLNKCVILVWTCSKGCESFFIITLHKLVLLIVILIQC